MRFFTFKLSALIFIAATFLFSCSDKTEQFETEPISDYVTLVPGKYITYRLDSLVFTNFGRNTEIHKYQEKHVIDAQINDGLGRPSYRVFRYLSDSIASTPWVPNGSYFITPLTDQLEVIDDNKRVIKLHLPIKEGFSWKGNRFLPTNPYDYISANNSYDDGMADWDFYYDVFEPALNYRNNTYTDVWTVEAADESFNVPIVNVDGYGSRVRSVDKYSKNIGLVYREYELWEYQPNTGQPGGPFKTGFGLTMWMVDHN